MADKKRGMGENLKNINNGISRALYPFMAGSGISAICFLLGTLECILVPLIPFGICWFKIMSLGFSPFGKKVIKKEQAGGAAVVGNVLWLIFNGWIVLLMFLCFGGAMVFIPGDGERQLDKVFAYAFLPFGRKVVKE